LSILSSFSLDLIKTIEDRGKKDVNLFIWAIVLIPVLGAGAAILTYVDNFERSGVSANPEQWGQLGDFFGGVLNPTFAFFSMLALCYTLALQFSQAKKTAQFNATQKFESFLLELIRLHRENLNSVDLWNKTTKKETRGRDCFVVFIRWIGKHYYSSDQNLSKSERLKKAYDRFYEDDQKKVELGHYFRNLYHIFKFIDESTIIDNHEKARYAKLVRAQLSTPELALLFFNGLSPKGANFKKYIEKYSILLDLTSRDLRIKDISQEDMQNEYSSAFQDKD
jgi:hypothetical protein